MNFTIYNATCIDSKINCRYPNRIEVGTESDLKDAVSRDYVCAGYLNDYRSNENFIGSDCLPADCDNTHSDNPADWVTPADVEGSFPGVSFAVHFSRNNMKAKDGRTPRPKFHILFPIPYTEDPEDYASLKRRLVSVFPWFDSKALDAARFFFGTRNPIVELHEGRMTVVDFLEEEEVLFDDGMCNGHDSGNVIPQGRRNDTLSRFAARILKRYGDTDMAHEAFMQRAEFCDPPLDDLELTTIWRSALGFFHRKVAKSEGYVSPEEYDDCADYRPADWSDVAQAETLAKHFSSVLRYSPATRYIFYDGTHWLESEPASQAMAQELTRRQMQQAEKLLAKAYSEAETAGVVAIVEGSSKSKLRSLLSDDQYELYKSWMDAESYLKFVIKRRESKNITGTLREARPLLEIGPEELDTDPFLLCTPDATFDLRKGLDGAMQHESTDYMTKMTAFSPGDEGKDLWLDCLELVFSGNKGLIDYVQMVCGLAAIGKVFVEAMVIAYGDGSNGKSTFWNTISNVMGSYSGGISADALTSGCRRNLKPEMAEVKGKRILIAAETQEGARLNDSMVKQLCSTDEIVAEKKYMAPFRFKPCHTLVLYTNFLPKVGGADEGIWRRLIVIPFTARITGKSDIKNYADYLSSNAGPYVMKWIIEGAKRVIEAKYVLPVPECVESAISDYRNRNDWFHHFLDDRCDVDASLRESSGRLYSEYRRYSMGSGEFTRGTADFYEALDRNGFKKVSSKGRHFILGLKVRDDADEDFTA